MSAALPLTGTTMLIAFGSCFIFCILGIMAPGLPGDGHTYNGKSHTSTTAAYFGWGFLGIVAAMTWNIFLTMAKYQDQVLNEDSLNSIMQTAFSLAAAMCLLQWARLRLAYLKERRHVTP